MKNQADAKKAKKLNILTYLVLAGLMVLTFVLSFTGAWFTLHDSKSIDTTSLKFGSVMLGTNFRVMSVSDIVPTETIDYHGGADDVNLLDIDYAGDIDAYYRITFDVTNTDSTEDAYSETFEKLLDFNTTSASLSANGQVRDDWSIYGKITPNNDIPRGTLRLSSETPNLFTDKTFHLKLKIDLIQGYNLSDIEGIGNLESNDTTAKRLSYQCLFYYYDWGTVADTEGLEYTANSVAADYATNKTCYVSGVGTANLPTGSPTGNTTLKIPQVVKINGVNHFVTGVGRTGSGVSSGFWSNGIQNIILSPYITDIGDYAFGAGGYYVSNIYTSPNVTSIGEYAFSGTGNNMLTCDIPSTVTNIGNFAFPNYKPYSLKLPPNVTIGASAFNGAQNVIMIVFGENSNSVSLSEQCFASMHSLLVLNLPKNFSNLNGRVILGSTDIQSLTVNAGNQTYYSSGNCVIRKSDNAIVCGCVNSVIPSSARIIENQAFYNTKDTIVIPYTITTLNAGCFYYNSLTSITLNNHNINIIGGFGSNKNITTINFNGTKAQFTWDKSIFLSGDRTLTVNCIDGIKEL